MSTVEFVKSLHEMTQKGESFAVATVVKVEGSTLGKPGFKALVASDGRIVAGSLGGVCPESAIAGVALETMESGEPRVIRIFLEATEDAVGATVRSKSRDEIHVETNCGGVLEVYVEPYLPAERLVLVGQGGKDDVEDALVRLAKIVKLRTVVIDHKPTLTEKPDELIEDLDFDLSSFNFKDSDSVVILTKGERDIETLERMSKRKVRFVGMLASRKRVREDKEMLMKRGVAARFIDELHAPVGLDIGSVSPDEIAVSIIADIIATKRGKQVARKDTAAGAPVQRAET